MYDEKTITTKMDRDLLDAVTAAIPVIEVLHRLSPVRRSQAMRNIVTRGLKGLATEAVTAGVDTSALDRFLDHEAGE